MKTLHISIIIVVSFVTGFLFLGDHEAQARCATDAHGKVIGLCSPSGGSHIAEDASVPPLKQFNSGIKAQDVKCKEDFMLVTKASNGSPACVKPISVKKLVSLKWALEPINDLTIEDFEDTYKSGEKINFTINYKGLYTCGVPSFTVKDAKNKTIWESPIILTLCDPDTGYGEYKWKFGDLYTLILNQTGSYHMKISFSDKMLEKKFEIK